MKNSDKNIVNLEISSWRGTSIGAVHYYGTLVCHHPEYREVELRRSLTAEDAKILTKLHNNGLLYGVEVYRYKKGDLVNSFDTQEEIIAMAKKVYKHLFPGKNVLLLGKSVYLDDKVIVLDEPISK